jgi:hypothetical protein
MKSRNIILHKSQKEQQMMELKEKNAEASDKISNFSMLVKDNALGDFKKQQEQDIVEVPPSAKSRRFNECDIIGDLDRDEKGNVVSALVGEKSG